VIEQRLEFCRLVDAGGVAMAELCRRFGIKRDTGYKWLARWRADGEAGLEDRSRAPKSSPNRTPDTVEALVVGVRRVNPAWGGRKIRGFLLRQGHQQIPAASTITQILRRHELLSDPKRPSAYASFEHPEPNDLWQMDFKGWFPLSNGNRVHTFGVLDDHSRFNLCLHACADQQTATVRGLLTSTFESYGLPRGLLMDNGSPWGNDLGQPWTPLTVWLTDLGIRVIHSRPWHPQTAGKQERFHHTLDLEVIERRAEWVSFPQVQSAYDQWRPLYNHHRPHQALGETIAPVDRYRPSPRSFPTEIPPPAYPPGTHVRKADDYNGRIRFRGATFRVGKAFRGHHVGIRPTTTPGLYTVHYRHHHIRTITLP
jgi:transposase InsO family protein